MAGNNLNNPPEKDEVEVSLFGPGFGECVVVHLGNGEWLVIDSCIDAGSTLPAAQNYFREIGVNCANAVKLIVATHWHDDHIAGLGDLFSACSQARFVCSAALMCSEWATLVETYRTYLQPGGSGVDEIRKVMAELKRRGRPNEIVAPQFAIANLPIFDRPHPSLQARVVALSPSPAAMAVMQTRIQQKLLPKQGRRRLRVPSLEENDGSVVLSVHIGSAALLLGADLEERGQAGLGWQVILDEDRGNNGRYEGFKVPHHGSVNGFHPDLWKRLMHEETAWGALTPYNRGKKLPTAIDCERILADTPRAFITAPPGLPRFRHPDRTVQKTMAEATLSIGNEPGRQGHVRLRREASLPAASTEWKVELFGEALPLQSLLHGFEGLTADEG